MRRLRWPGADTSILAAVLAAVALVAAFAFGQSYEHIYDLARANGQPLISSKLLPLTVDLLIVAATLIMALQKRAGAELSWVARILPRSLLWAGIVATVAANVAAGLPHGNLSAALSAWPGGVFAALVETVLVSVRPVQRAAARATTTLQVGGQIPVTSLDAARTAAMASTAAGNPLTGYSLSKRFGVSVHAGNKIAAEAKTALNGDGSHE